MQFSCIYENEIAYKLKPLIMKREVYIIAYFGVGFNIGCFLNYA